MPPTPLWRNGVYRRIWQLLFVGNPLTAWLQRTTMYRLMLYYLIALLVAAIVFSWLGIFGYTTADIIVQALVFVLVCWGVNRIAARLLRIPSNIESALITSLILAAIAGPLSLPQDWLVLVVMAGAAIGSKYIFVIRRSHIFNPAAFGVTVSALLLDYPASWWIGSQSSLLIILVGGVLMMAKLRRWHLLLSFFGTYLGLIALDALLWQGRSVFEAVTAVQNLVTSAALLFFAFVMLVEPLTAPQTQRRRLAFGAFVGLALFMLQRFVMVPYSLELALLLGNVFTWVIEPSFKQAFVLRRKEIFSPAIGNFWFTPQRRFAFVPGQFLEYTYAHPRSDARGIRRYFSIASSPTEPEILMTARFASPGSTFKKELQRMNEGAEIVASKVAGDFVLPADVQQKIAFIAGGIGITPFRSMVKYLLDIDQARDIVLLYGAREEKDFVFREVFEEAHKKFNMRTTYISSRVIDETVIRNEAPDFADRLFYISGPEPMVQGLSRILLDMGVARRQIKRDYFPGYTD